MRRIAVTAAATLALLAGLLPSAGAGPVVLNEIQIIADAGAQAFAVRPSYDSGGATPLNFYIGYTEANVSTPEPQADGQASWYNFGIAETAAFRPPEDCTPQKNLAATIGDTDGGGNPRNGTVQDLGAWLVAYQQEVVAAMQAGQQPGPPTVPSFRHACSERLPGFTQSRHPATHRCEDGACSGIKQSDRDDLTTKPFCKDPASCSGWKSLDAATSAFATDGSFSSVAGEAPSDSSTAVLAGLGDGTAISIGFASSHARTTLDGSTLTAEATSSLRDVCLMRSEAGCALHIDELRETAGVRVAPGKKPVASARTTLFGVRERGQAGETDVIVLDETTQPFAGKAVNYDGGDSRFHLQPVSKTGGCTPVQGASSYAIADAGGLRIFGKGSSGGGIVIGGACARARIDQVELTPIAQIGEPPIPPVPPTRTVVTDPPPPCPACGGAPRVIVGPPRVVTRELVSFKTRPAPAWRTVAYWAPSLAAILALGLLGWLFRARPALQPVVRTVDRFARQFVKG